VYERNGMKDTSADCHNEHDEAAAAPGDDDAMKKAATMTIDNTIDRRVGVIVNVVIIDDAPATRLTLAVAEALKIRSVGGGSWR
jgi:hypothetical protein